MITPPQELHHHLEMIHSHTLLRNKHTPKRIRTVQCMAPFVREPIPMDDKYADKIEWLWLQFHLIESLQHKEDILFTKRIFLCKRQHDTVLQLKYSFFFILFYLHKASCKIMLITAWRTDFKRSKRNKYDGDNVRYYKK